MPAAAAAPAKRIMSASARRKIAMAQRKRWAQVRAGQKKGGVEKMSPLRVCGGLVPCLPVAFQCGGRAAAVQLPTHAVRHATRSSASLRGRNPGMRRLLISSGAPFCFGLKRIDTTDPIPRPTKRNVIAEFKSYSLLFITPSISTSLPWRSCKMRSSESLLVPARTVPLYKSPLFSD
jgi:hypothetical protein